MGFARWLRQNSEHYLIVDAQRRVAEKYGRPGPSPPKTLRERFWLDVFAPAYRRLPWSLRRSTIQAIPGSHRQRWTPPPPRGVPAVRPDGTVAGMTRPAVSTTGPETTGPETRGE